MWMVNIQNIFVLFSSFFDNFMGKFSVFFWATQTIRSLHEWRWKRSFVYQCTYQTKFPNTDSNFLLVGTPHDDTIVLAITELSQLLVLPLFSILLLNPLCCSSAGWLAFPWCVIIAVRALEDWAKGSSWKREKMYVFNLVIRSWYKAIPPYLYRWCGVKEMMRVSSGHQWSAANPTGHGRRPSRCLTATTSAVAGPVPIGRHQQLGHNHVAALWRHDWRHHLRGRDGGVDIALVIIVFQGAPCPKNARLRGHLSFSMYHPPASSTGVG